MFLLLCQSNLPVIDEKYPHIVCIEGENDDDIGQKASIYGGQTIDLEGSFHIFKRRLSIS